MAVFGRIEHNGKAHYAEIENDVAHFIASPFDYVTGDVQRSGESVALANTKILAPVVPTKLFAIGLNYANHAVESGKPIPSEPLMWFKSPTAIIAHEETIEIAYPQNRTDWEAELTIVIGKPCKGVSEENALDYVLGYTCGQDISDRVVQKAESQWARAKSFDTYAPLGPFIVTDLEPDNLQVQSWVNGEIKQDGNTSDMIFPVRKLISFLSECITLLPGDCIMTGTPEGIGALRSGDVVETKISGIPSLKNFVRERGEARG